MIFAGGLFQRRGATVHLPGDRRSSTTGLEGADSGGVSDGGCGWLGVGVKIILVFLLYFWTY